MKMEIFENIESDLFDLKESLDSKIIEFKKIGNDDLETKMNLKKKLMRFRNKLM